jgi:hypothetical protein
MGLYDDENAGVTSGDYHGEELFTAKATAWMLHDAVVSGQPREALLWWLPTGLEKIDAALNVYPNHEDLLHWKGEGERLLREETRPERPVTWKSGFPWAQDKFRAGFAALEYARFAHDYGDQGIAYVQARKAKTNLADCHSTADWPTDKQTLLADGIREAEEIEEATRNAH